MTENFWSYLDHLVANSELEIDRPQGSVHTRFPDMIYPFDYGYLAGTVSPDGGGIDVWVGTANERRVTGILCTVDLLKRDMEIKILLGCTPKDMETIVDFVNSGDTRCTLVCR